jgi:hypothetical protein
MPELRQASELAAEGFEDVAEQNNALRSALDATRQELYDVYEQIAALERTADEVSGMSDQNANCRIASQAE